VNLRSWRFCKIFGESRSLLLARDRDSIAAGSTHADMAKEDLIQNPATLDSTTRQSTHLRSAKLAIDDIQLIDVPRVNIAKVLRESDLVRQAGNTSHRLIFCPRPNAGFCHAASQLCFHLGVRLSKCGSGLLKDVP
jgi:hypothetical protein